MRRFDGGAWPQAGPIASLPVSAYLGPMYTFFDIVLYGLLAAVFLILVGGVYALFRGGDFGRSWSNKLMRARVLFQFLVILVLVAGVWAKNQFGG